MPYMPASMASVHTRCTLSTHHDAVLPPCNSSALHLNPQSHVSLAYSTHTLEHWLMLGGGMMSKFVGVFRELSTFTELLHTQIELILVERLHHNWLKVHCWRCPWSRPQHAACRMYAFHISRSCHQHQLILISCYLLPPSSAPKCPVQKLM